jgi:hypothetical protein
MKMSPRLKTTLQFGGDVLQVFDADLLFSTLSTQGQYQTITGAAMSQTANV